MVPVEALTQIMTFQYKIDFVNEIAIPEFLETGDETRHVDVLANLVRLNWMVDNLQTHPMVKPIIATHNGNKEWRTVVGDTRLAALELMGASHCRLILQSPSIPEEHGVVTGWIEIPDLESAGLLAGVGEGRVMTDPEDWENQEIYWMEFDTPLAGNHMHDMEQRREMIHNYLRENPDVRISREWFQTLIDWSKYSSR